MDEPTLFDTQDKPREKTHACPGEGCRVCALLEKPHLPYAGTSGWSGSDTSESRAREADRSGTTSARQSATLELLDGVGEVGMTWSELSQVTGWHHGTASGMLSVLHGAGEIARLQERRARCKVYVLPEYASGRATEAPRARRTACPHCGGAL
jgi:hypothetical protein